MIFIYFTYFYLIIINIVIQILLLLTLVTQKLVKQANTSITMNQQDSNTKLPQKQQNVLSDLQHQSSEDQGLPSKQKIYQNDHQQQKQQQQQQQHDYQNQSQSEQEQDQHQELEQEQEQEDDIDEYQYQDEQNEDPLVIIGKATFIPSIRQVQLSQQISTTLYSGFWSTSYDEYKLQNWALIFSYMIQCSFCTLNMQYKKYTNIPKEICYVNFTNLTMLDISQNKIENIQALCLIQLSNIQSLGICCNYISRLTCFKKMRLPNIENLYLHENYIYEINFLSKTELNSRVIEWFTIQKFTSETRFCEDLSQLAKISFGGFYELWIRSKKRIRQYRLRWRQIQKKFKQIRCLDCQDDI